MLVQIIGTSYSVVSTQNLRLIAALQGQRQGSITSATAKSFNWRCLGLDWDLLACQGDAVIVSHGPLEGRGSCKWDVIQLGGFIEEGELAGTLLQRA